MDFKNWWNAILKLFKRKSVVAVRSMPESPWMEIAYREMGVSEISGSEHNARILEYHKSTMKFGTVMADEIPWCSSFVNWVLEAAGLPGTKNPSARSWLRWGRKLRAPRYGCVVVLWRDNSASWKGHVGFYVSDSALPGYITILGGNQGDRVSEARYPKSRVLSYRWPKEVGHG